jgi:hypothetical protein
MGNDLLEDECWVFVQLPTPTTSEWIDELKAAAVRVQELNTLAALVHITTEWAPTYIPIPSNPDPADIYGYLGLFNTPPNDLGQVRVKINRRYLRNADLPEQIGVFGLINGRPPVGDVI